jgi:hypothetical protein
MRACAHAYKPKLSVAAPTQIAGQRSLTHRFMHMYSHMVVSFSRLNALTHADMHVYPHHLVHRGKNLCINQEN